jgi:hypothetical protein
MGLYVAECAATYLVVKSLHYSWGLDATNLMLVGRKMAALGIKPSKMIGGFHQSIAHHRCGMRLCPQSGNQRGIIRRLKEILPPVRDDNLHTV